MPGDDGRDESTRPSRATVSPLALVWLAPGGRKGRLSITRLDAGGWIVAEAVAPPEDVAGVIAPSWKLSPAASTLDGLEPEQGPWQVWTKEVGRAVVVLPMAEASAEPACHRHKQILLSPPNKRLDRVAVRDGVEQLTRAACYARVAPFGGYARLSACGEVARGRGGEEQPAAKRQVRC